MCKNKGKVTWRRIVCNQIEGIHNRVTTDNIIFLVIKECVKLTASITLVCIIFMNLIDRINQIIGNAVAWLVLLMVFGTLYNVVARYFFGQFSIPLGEVVTIMNAVVFLLAAPLLLYLDQHVRVDVFYERLSTRGQAIVDFLGTLFLLLPLCGFILYYSWGYVEASWVQQEASAQTGGLPALYLVKSLIIVVAVMLILQGLSLLVHKAQLIKKPQTPHPEHHHEEPLL